MIENKYLPVRLLFYFVRKSNKKLHWKDITIKQITLSRPDVTEVGGCLVLHNYLRKEMLKANWKYVIKALKEEAERLYPEFVGKVIISDEKE